MPQPRNSWALFWSIFVFAAGLGAGTVRLVIDHQRQDFIRDERLRVLEMIVVSQFPEWTKAIWWDD